MENIIIVAVILIITGIALGYIIKAKKSGKTCIGCPDNGNCPSQKNRKCNGDCTSCGNPK